ncbi:dual specificity protein phosphatase CDC14B-like isoform X2 [Agrilus planipennis]|nr:dual specificity protein phosphatase CDC14B-like isoform X2 [Agrilus planipennis]XP_025833394.1 dual specificity protein phosphatase CDC14B-like isoform X2 [Agrilus planipennis]
MDCFRAIKKCSSLNFFNFDDFSVAEYDNHDKLVNGDMNWLVPLKFLAFIGPTEIESTADCFNGHNPSFYINYFITNDVRTVIRLNNRVYNESAFTKAGIEHYDLFFPDGTIPPKHILLKFLDIAEHAPASIAVHCKAGLGRTGSLIGAYIIKHYHLTAREAISWMRICRPGSVIGPQQDWLEKIEKWLWKQGSHYRNRHFGDGDKIPFHKYGIYSIKWMNERDKGLRDAKKDTAKRRSVCDEVNQMSTQNKVFAQKQSIERKKMLLNQKEEELRRLSNLLYKVQTKQKTRRKGDDEFATNPSASPVDIDNRLRRSKTAAVKRGDREMDVPLEYMGQLKRRITTAITNRNSAQNQIYSFEQIPMTPLCSSMKTGRRRDYPDGHKKHATQGDKLNDIKIKRFIERIGSAKSSGRPQQVDVGMERREFSTMDNKKPGKIASNLLKKLPIIQRSRRSDMIA